MENSLEILNRYWGYPAFRPNQEKIVKDCIEGNDVFALLPTGGGKSICFQVPAMSKEGICIVVSPLIALMQDQVANLQKIGIAAKALTSEMNYRQLDIELDNARFGSYKFLYVSPERIQTSVFQERLKIMDVNLFVVDEAHCISEWGHDFRPSYLKLHLLREIHPKTPILALTATATKKVQEDIIEQLKLNKPKCHIHSLQRSNVVLKAFYSEQKLKRIAHYCKATQGIGIVYCQTRKSVKKVAQFLLDQNISCGIYHGGMNMNERKEMLHSWLMENISVMVSTNAFGMGIDKPNVRYVLHYDMPSNLEAYMQESGRAGRDGKTSEAIAFYNETDLNELENHVSKQFPQKETILQAYIAINNYLRLAVGSGRNETFELDYRDLCKKYKFDVQEFYYSLKILCQNGFFSLDENTAHSSQIQVIVTNYQLYNFQLTHPNFQDLINLLMHTVPGIQEKRKEFSENHISRKLNVPLIELKNRLETMQRLGIIDLKWASELPQITYLKERVSEQNFELNYALYSLRKEVFQQRIKAVSSYLRAHECRAVKLLSYFEEEGEKCGQCDNCKQEKQTPYLKEKILSHLKKESSLNELIDTFESKESILLDILQDLILEDLIEWNGKGYCAK